MKESTFYPYKMQCNLIVKEMTMNDANCKERPAIGIRPFFFQEANWKMQYFWEFSAQDTTFWNSTLRGKETNGYLSEKEFVKNTQDK